MQGQICFDIDTAPITEEPFYCPFTLNNKEYSWIVEYLQA